MRRAARAATGHRADSSCVRGCRVPSSRLTIVAGAPPSPPRRGLSRPAPRRGCRDARSPDRSTRWPTSRSQPRSTGVRPSRDSSPIRDRPPATPAGCRSSRYHAVPDAVRRRAARPAVAGHGASSARRRWCAVDLRDGNQALIDPMSPARKRRMFNLLVRMGYKEIEVGFPAASQTDFDFVRQLIEQDLIPDDVTIQVLTQCREHADRAHLRVAARRPAGDRALLQLDLDPAAPGRVRPGPGRHHRDRDRRRPAVPEVRRDPHARTPTSSTSTRPSRYTGTELEYALEVCSAVIDVIDPTPGPAADHQPAGDGRDGHPERVRRLDRVDAPQPAPARRRSCCRLHPHNDRGTASPRPSWACWPAPTGSRAACSATASAPATSTWSRWG